MKTDRELLELAAKAAGIAILRSRLDNPICADMLLVERTEDGHAIGWNPFTDDGDALRLAVRLQLTIANEHVSAGAAYCTSEDGLFPDVNCRESRSSEVLPSDYAATRRAIVLAAAEIGEAMP